MQVVFQSPVASLDPRSTVLDAVAEPLRTHTSLSRAGSRDRGSRPCSTRSAWAGHTSAATRTRCPAASASEWRSPGRSPCARSSSSWTNRPPRSTSRSRRRSSTCSPTCAPEHGLAYLLISHDLDVVAHLSDRIGIMYLGRLVEEGPTAAILAGPAHPYGEALLSSAPVIPGSDRPPRPERILSGDIPSPTDPPPGCRFHPRCPRREELGGPTDCRTIDPALVPNGTGRAVACHHPLDGPVPVDAHPPGRSLP